MFCKNHSADNDSHNGIILEHRLHGQQFMLHVTLLPNARRQVSSIKNREQIVIPQQCPEQKISEQDREAEAVQDHRHTMQLGTDIQCHFGRNQAA
jgi:hypothetical protein